MQRHPAEIDDIAAEPRFAIVSRGVGQDRMPSWVVTQHHRGKDHAAITRFNHVAVRTGPFVVEFLHVPPSFASVQAARGIRGDDRAGRVRNILLPVPIGLLLLVAEGQNNRAVAGQNQRTR